MTPILLAGGQWSSISGLYAVLSGIISIIGLYILLPGVYKAFAGWKEGHGSQLQDGAKDIVLGIAILFFGVFFLPALQNALSHVGNNSNPKTISISADGGSFTTYTADQVKKLYEDNDADDLYIMMTSESASMLAKGYTSIFDAIDAAPNIMTSQGTTNGVAIGKVTQFVQDLANSICIALKSLGFALALLFFLTSIIEFAKEDRLTIEIFIKHFSKFFVSMGFVAFADKILTECWKLGDEIASFLATAVSVTNKNISRADIKNTFEYMLLQDRIKDASAGGSSADMDGLMGFFAAIPQAVSSLGIALIFILVGYALMGFMYFIAFSRLIEMAARGSFLPVAFGVMADDGWRGAGGRYVKKLLAVISQVGILIVIARIGTNIIYMVGMSTVMGNNPFQSMVILCGVGFALVSAMFKSIGWMNDAFGA